MNRMIALAGALTIAASITACSVTPEDLPSVRAGVGDTYDLTIEFVSVLNLPTGADVMMDGIRVGEVRDLDITTDGVLVHTGIRKDASVPSNAMAIVRQDTLLGDTYVAVVRDEGGSDSGNLEDGSVIPVERTTSPPQLEDTMAVLATFTNGGSIRRIEDVMARVNSVMPSVPKVQGLASIVAVDLRDLGAKTATVDRMLEEMNSVASTIADNGEELSTIFGESAVHYWRRVASDIVAHIGQILPSIGSVYEGGMWLVPMLDSLADTGDVVVDSAGATVDLANFLSTTLIPYASHPSVDIVSIESTDGRQLVADAENVLRMMGAVR